MNAVNLASVAGLWQRGEDGRVCSHFFEASEDAMARERLHLQPQSGPARSSVARVAVEKPSEERSSPHALCCTQDPAFGSCRQTEEFDDAKPSTNCVWPSLPAKPGNGLTS